MLNALVDDTRKSEKQLNSARSTVMRLNTEIADLNEQLKQLTTTLSIKKAAFKTAQSTQYELSRRLITNELKKTGLGIRYCY